MSQCEASSQPLLGARCVRDVLFTSRHESRACDSDGADRGRQLAYHDMGQTAPPSHRPSARDGLIFRAHIFPTALIFLHKPHRTPRSSRRGFTHALNIAKSGSTSSLGITSPLHALRTRTCQTAEKHAFPRTNTFALLPTIDRPH